MAGGILIGHAGVYDILGRLVLGPFIEGIAATSRRSLRRRTGPRDRLQARPPVDPTSPHYAFEVTGPDLDPTMIARARANADRPGNGDQRRPSFVVGDVATLAFPNGSFNLVVSTLSMHRWDDPTAGLAEIDCVLRSGGRALTGTSARRPAPSV